MASMRNAAGEYKTTVAHLKYSYVATREQEHVRLKFAR